jgi:hypothetical protein
MGMRWFEDPAEGERLGDQLVRLTAAVSRMLDGLGSPAVAPGTGRVAAADSAVLLPLTAVPGGRLVVQVAEWSSSVACWWSLGGDWRAHPGAPELFAEFPLEPDGTARALAWLERELRRPVVIRSRGSWLARRQRWVVTADDGAELVIRRRWLPGWGGAADGGAGLVPGTGSWLLGAAVAAAGARWLLAALTPELLGASWLDWAARVLDLAAFAALLVWFNLAAAGRPARLRAPMRAGLLLAALSVGVALLPGAGELPPVADAPRALGLMVPGWLPSLLGAAAVACYLVAFLGLPAPAARPPWPRVLPVVAGLALAADAAVGLWWLAWFEPASPDEAVLLWPGVLLSAARVAAAGLAVVLVFVVADRRPALARPAARAGLAGALLLVLAWSFSLQLLISWLVPQLPPTLGSAIFGAPVLLAPFAGTALLAVAAAAPQTASRVGGRPSASTATASPRNPTARPSWGE